MTDRIPPSRKALTEALELSADILRNIELNELPLANITLKTSRLARLLNDFESEQIFRYESSGYPITPSGVPKEAFHLASKAGRMFEKNDPKSKTKQQLIYWESISDLEESIATGKTALQAAEDPDVSVTSANPQQYVFNPVGNKNERDQIRRQIGVSANHLSSRRAYVHQYALHKHYELKFSGISEDIFARIRERVDDTIGLKLPESLKRFAAVYENLQSENSENWANAVHSCRRILEDLADAVFPAQDKPLIKEINEKRMEVKLGKSNHINRIIAFVEKQSTSDRFVEIVGSHLDYIGNRLDSIFKASQKGSHSIVTKEEADRYVIFTYLLIGDILNLHIET